MKTTVSYQRTARTPNSQLSLLAAATVLLVVPSLSLAQPAAPSVSSGTVSTAASLGSAQEPLAQCGSARLKVMFWDVYESTLYTPGGVWREGVRPLRLEIRYLRDIAALDLVKQTGKEWRAQDKSGPEHTVWQGELLGMWPDVQAGDVIALALDTEGRSTFYFNGDAIGNIADPRFGEDFAGIWLSADTSRPGLRAQLIQGADSLTADR